VSRVTVPFFVSNQGCPHVCAFCDQRTINGSDGALPTRDEIAAKIMAWRCTSANRPMEVAFFGGTFTGLHRKDQEYLLSATRPFLTSGDVDSVRISTRPDSLDADTVRWLSGWGVKTIEIGAQSMDDDTLAASGRGHNAEASLKALSCVKSAGLSAGVQLMPGLPGDTIAKSKNSLKLVIAAGADFVRLYPVVVLKGTELSARYLSGEYRALSLDDGLTLCKTLTHMALASGVRVIRMGLQADSGMREENIVAGCWHPAFGDLVYSELFYDLLKLMRSDLGFGNGPVTVACHPSRVSNVAGHSKKNIRRLGEQGFVIRQIIPDPALSVFECDVRTLNKRAKKSIILDLSYDA